jgi:hypothetical protein
LKRPEADREADHFTADHAAATTGVAGSEAVPGRDRWDERPNIDPNDVPSSIEHCRATREVGIRRSEIGIYEGGVVGHGYAGRVTPRPGVRSVAVVQGQHPHCVANRRLVGPKDQRAIRIPIDRLEHGDVALRIGGVDSVRTVNWDSLAQAKYR